MDAVSSAKRRGVVVIQDLSPSASSAQRRNRRTTFRFLPIRPSPLYRQHKIALQAVAAGPGLAVGNASYLSYLKSQGIRLGLLPAGLGTNGFIERFEVCVRKNFLADALRDQAVGGLEGLQAGFDDWLEPYTHATPRAG